MSITVQNKVGEIQKCLQSAKVKTASPSRGGFKVQVRVTWKDLAGKPGLGYFSMHTAMVSKAANHTSQKWTRDFVNAVFRVEDWAKAEESKDASKDSHLLQKKVLDELEKLGEFAVGSPAEKLTDKAFKEIRAVVASGKDQKVKRIRGRLKARDYLHQAIMYALREGLRDDEVRDLVKECLVEHTMKS